MARVNTTSIINKVKGFMATKEGKEKIDSSVTNSNGSMVDMMYKAADKFVLTLRESIDTNTILSSHAREALNSIDITCGSPQKYSTSSGEYYIHIYFSGDISRASLDPNSYPEGVDDIVLLLNNGVDHEMRPVHGKWNGEDCWSRTIIPAAEFINDAIRDFKTNYGSDYNIIDIKLL